MPTPSSKILLTRRPSSTPLLVVNRAVGELEARSAAQRLTEVSAKFLGREPRWVGTLPEDRAIFRSIQRRQPVVTCEPESDLAHALGSLQSALVRELERLPARGLGRSRARHIGYVPRRN